MAAFVLKIRPDTITGPQATPVWSMQVSVHLIAGAGQEDLFEEDIGEQAVEEELAPLTVQLALVQSRLGRHDEALAAYQVRACAQHPSPCCVNLGFGWRCCTAATRGSLPTAKCPLALLEAIGIWLVYTGMFNSGEVS
jgi:hypothetical protein